MREKLKAGGWERTDSSHEWVLVRRWLRLGVVLATALAHAVVCRRRWLHNNTISTISNGAFAGLTALTELYDTGLWAAWFLLHLSAS
jgi:hypothetical protein